jgi:hypothetical protein
MKHLFQTVTLTLLIAGLIFYSCKKEISCEGCQTNAQTSNIRKPPIALAGSDQTTTLPTDSILLDGSASSDPDGIITAWQWAKVSGPPSFSIVNANNLKTQVNNLAEGIYLFELKVTDNDGLSARDTVQIRVVRSIFNPNSKIIYIAGYGWNANGKKIARVWKNGELQDLSNGENDAFAFSIAVSDTDVFVAGTEGGKAVLWKNGIAQILGDGNARSVFVSGRDIYIAGISANNAVVWKNGAAITLANGQNYLAAEANSVFVSGNDVYVAGWKYPEGAQLWKNGLAQTLTPIGGTEDAYPNAIFMSGNDVYVVGTCHSMFSFGIPTIWENGLPKFLGTREGEANSVFVSGNDVYVAGKIVGSGNDSSHAIIWKNGEATSLTNEPNRTNINVRSLFVSDNTVYATGFRVSNSSRAESLLWINGVEYTLSSFTEAHSVFVQ